ncbi:MAG: ankyrin repeat domain-containing protein, partial [Planctomycetota bacterium]|nr:ankyrin repeat domain-containing protein [Planctomycetota bacterium]
RLFREIYRDVDRLGGHAPKLNEFGGTALVAEKSAPPEAAGGQGGRGGGKVYALLVGIQYSDGLSTLSRLYGTERDVQAMRDALLRYGGCDEGDIAILADRDRPDRNRIIGELRTLAGKAGPGDRIMFFYSGHGGGENGYGFICPAGFRDNEDGVWYSNDIKPILESSAAASKWMILDTCLSGLKSYGRRRALENLDMFVSDREEGSGRRRGPSFPVNQVVREVIKFSGAYGDEFTYEVGDLDHRMGIFTHFLTRGIAGEADADGDGLLTGGELVSFVQPKVLEETSQPGYELPQKPRLSENGYEVVLSAIRGPAPPGPTPTPVQDGMSPLHRAALDGDVAQAERLLDSGLDVNLRDGSGWTPLHYASDPKMANLFMARGADVNRQSNAGFTPLHAAALLDRNAAAAALLKGGANRNLRDKWGKTPFSRALERNNAELLKILEK